MTLTKYPTIWDELEDFPRSMKLFEEPFKFFANEPAMRPWTPAVDVLETEHELTVRADLPGMKMEDIEVRIEKGTLHIKGVRKFEQEEKGKGYHRIERNYGTFMRAFVLPEIVDVEKVRAEYKEGVLSVIFAKLEAAKPKAVKVEVTTK